MILNSVCCDEKMIWFVFGDKFMIDYSRWKSLFCLIFVVMSFVWLLCDGFRISLVNCEFYHHLQSFYFKKNHLHTVSIDFVVTVRNL